MYPGTRERGRGGWMRGGRVRMPYFMRAWSGRAVESAGTFPLR